MSVRPNGISGQYGDMPEDAYLRKMEKTCYWEPEDQVEQHIRGLLVDYSPDAPFFASEQIRGGSTDQNGQHRGGFESGGRLNLRHSGKRSLSEPTLPDGTFLDHVFLEKDPRGTNNNPDMRKMNDQSYARASHIKYSPDADWSIPESAVNPHQQVQKMKHSFYQAKDRMKIFDTAKDAWHNGFQSKRLGKKHAKEVMTQDDLILDLAEASQGNRRDATAQLSDEPMGWRQFTTDHKVKVAKYGMIRANMNNKSQDWRANRSSTYLDHQQQVDLGGERMNRALAILMMDLKGLKRAKHISKDSMEFTEAKSGPINRSKHFTPADMMIIQKFVEYAQSHSAHTLLNGDQKARNAQRKQYIRQPHGKVIINQEIIEFMQMICKPGYQGNPEDLREYIQQSADDHGIYVEQNTRQKGSDIIDPNAKWYTGVSHDILEGKQITNYSGITPVVDRHELNYASFENYASKSRQNKQKKNKYKKLPGVRNTKSTAAMNEFGTLSRYCGKVSNKMQIRRHISDDTIHDDINDSDMIMRF